MAILQTNLYGLANFTPYTMTLTYKAASQGSDPTFTPFDANAMPAQTIPPGANMVFALFTDMVEPLGASPVGGNYATAELHYDFTDVDGGQHRCRYLVGPDKGLYVYSQDLSDGTYVNSTATFEITASSAIQINCVLTHPAEVTIDAVQDPEAATSVLANLWPQGTNKQFTATTPLTFVTGPFTRGSAIVQNKSGGQVQLTYGSGVTAEETTSIGWEVSWTLSWSILGIVNEQVSGSVTGAQNWSTSYSTTQDYTVVIPPQQQGWLEWAVTSAQITGDLTFTWTPPSGAVTPAGITYHVTNATVTQPGRNSDPTLPVATWQEHVEAIPVTPPGNAIAGGGVRPAGLGSAPRLTANASVVIDAATDPAGAAQAMQLWPNAANKTFTPTSNPAYPAPTQPAYVSNAYQIPVGQPAAPTDIPTTLTTAASWSIGGSVGDQITADALGLAATSVSATFTAGHEWSNSQTYTQTITVDVQPGTESWVTGYQSQATFTGDYTFTAQGTDYTVNNVSVTFPAAPDCGPLTAFTYIVESQPLSSSVAATVTRPGWVAAPPNRQEAALGSPQNVLGHNPPPGPDAGQPPRLPAPGGSQPPRTGQRPPTGHPETPSGSSHRRDRLGH